MPGSSVMKTREWLLQAGLLIVSLAVSLGFAEAVLRVKNSSGQNYDIEMWRYAKELKRRSDIEAISHEHIVNARAQLQNVDIRTNELGMRGGPVGPLKPGMRRILFLGSSITLGWGVEEKDTVTARLQDMFQRNHQAVEVLNGGVGNYNTTRYVELFLNRLANVESTDIVIHYFLRDAEVLSPGNANFLVQHSELAVTLWQAVHRVIDRSGEAALDAHYRDVYRPESQGYREMLASLDRLKVHTAARGIRVYLAMQPDVHNLTNYPFRFIHERMEKVSRERGFRYVDLLPEFAGQSPSKIWAMSGDPHPNAFGHKLMADAIYPALQLP
jgi:lysophospholipase L1-like esterase